MSHWVEKKANFKDIDALKEACTMLGLQLIQNAKARGWSSNTIQADYVIKLNGSYDVALINNGDGYDISADWYDGSVARAIGKEGNNLKQAYTAAATVKVARAQGHPVEMQRVENGDIRLVLKVGARG
ncbi:DUF1257 domain-containing protein [Paenibacillus oralis]|uniref:DUF1257 domain-containing protein n=1 Tax=Paenibacillus oralis TaxID=2490856 RepID=A0A3P3TA27_9BACL|nr:DUF1257 domain-containing protein [Paenibacillus oralis]RRJ54810.1 DUF1257 domain-containing protein [Paenibacillus oralis]